MLKRLQKFPENHPLLVKLAGAGLCIAGASAGAVTVPAIMAALGIKMAVVGTTSVLSAGTGAAAVQGTAVAGAVVAGAKILFSTMAIEIGGMLLAGPPSPDRRYGSLWGRRRSNSGSRVGVMADVPLLSSRR